LFRRAAEQGNASAQFNLGTMYYRGEGLPIDHAEARRWSNMAEAQGRRADWLIPLSMIDYGLPNGDEALRWHLEAAGRGHVGAMNNLGHMYDSRFGLDMAKAREWFRKSAEHGYAEGQFNYALHSGDNPAELEKWLRKAADQGHGIAQYFLAKRYRDGNEPARDMDEALRFMRLAAEQGLHLAQVDLAAMLVSGNGIPLDYAEAAGWYRRAAEQDNVEAQFMLGLLLDEGLGVRQDYEEASTWYAKAVERDDVDAQVRLGLMYAEGRGVQQDMNKAVKLLQDRLPQWAMAEQTTI